jgi:hypothetical protein
LALMSAAQIRMAKRSPDEAFDRCAGALDDHSIKAAQVTRNPDMRICFVSGR